MDNIKLSKFVDGLNLDKNRKKILIAFIEELIKESETSDYKLPLASKDVRGGIKTGYDQNGKNYPVQLNDTEQAYVSVPWTDNNTTYSKATDATLGLVKIGYAANGKNYPIVLDGDGKMYVAVPWTDTKYNLPTATPNSIGGVKQGPKVANASSDADTVALGTKINELIASLRSAGVII